MKYNLTSSNFKATYQKYKNPFHPFLNQNFHPADPNYFRFMEIHNLPSIFDFVVIKDRKTKALIKENEKLLPGEIK